MKKIIFPMLTLVLALATGVLIWLNLQMKDDYNQLAKLLVDESHQEGVLMIDGVQYGSGLVKVDHNKLWIPLSKVQEAIDDTIVVSGSGQRIYIDSDHFYFEHEDERLSAYVKAHAPAINLPLYFIDEVPYLEAETVAKVYGLKVKTFEETGSAIIYSQDHPLYEGIIPSGTALYEKIRESERIKWDQTSTDTHVYVIDIANEYVYTVFDSGRSYDVKMSDIQGLNPLDTSIQAYTSQGLNVKEPISLSWEAVETYKASLLKSDTTFETSLNVISPTWFNLNVNGIIINEADLGYVNNAHEQGLAVWGLYKNNFDPEWTSNLLANRIDQASSIAQVLFYANFYDLEGINIDFENIYLSDQASLTDYVSDLHEVLSMDKLILSMDMTRPGGSDQWSKVYDRSELSQSLDYVMLMAYDEFWGSSPLSGPVASIPWTQASIEMSLEEIPRDKLILGIPFYMRQWEETKSGNKWQKTGSKAITIEAAQTIIKDNNLEVTYDSDNLVNYVEYIEEGIRYRIWLEDELSLVQRLGLADDFNLPGIASWRRGYGNATFDMMIKDWRETRE